MLYLCRGPSPTALQQPFNNGTFRIHQKTPTEIYTPAAMAEASTTSSSSSSNDQMSSIATTLPGSTASTLISKTDVTIANANASAEASSDTAVATEKGTCLDAFQLEHVEVTSKATNPTKNPAKGKPNSSVGCTELCKVGGIKIKELV